MYPSLVGQIITDETTEAISKLDDDAFTLILPSFGAMIEHMKTDEGIEDVFVDAMRDTATRQLIVRELLEEPVAEGATCEFTPHEPVDDALDEAIAAGANPLTLGDTIDLSKFPKCGAPAVVTLVITMENAPITKKRVALCAQHREQAVTKTETPPPTGPAIQ